MQGQLDKDTCLGSMTLRCVKTDYFECVYLACLGMEVRYQDSVYKGNHIKLLNKNNVQLFYFCHGVDQINSFFSVNILSYTYMLF